MKTRIVLASILLTIGVNTEVAAQRGGGGGGGGAGATCRPSDEQVSYALSALRKLVTSTDTAVVAARQRRGLPAVASSQVSYVLDNSVCSKAEKAYTPAVVGGSATPSLQVYVFKVGNVYQIWDPVQRAGEFTIAMTLSGSYKVLAKYSL